jgi:hypothetical protein
MAKSISTARSYEVKKTPGEEKAEKLAKKEPKKVTKKTEQVIEITQKNLLHDFEQEEVDDDTASNDE